MQQADYHRHQPYSWTPFYSCIIYYSETDIDDANAISALVGKIWKDSTV